MTDILTMNLNYATRLRRLLAGVTPHASCRVSIDSREHTWFSFTAYTTDAKVGVFCAECGADGVFEMERGAFFEALPDIASQAVHVDAVILIRHRLSKWRSEVDAILTNVGGLHPRYS